MLIYKAVHMHPYCKYMIRYSFYTGTKTIGKLAL